MISAILGLSLAFAHGDDDHGAPPPAAAAASAARVPTWSSEFDVVLRLDDLQPGTPGTASLLVADARTSAPVAAGRATLRFEGTAPLTVEVAAGEFPGEWPFDLTLPDAGPWRSALTLITPDRADALGLPAFTLDHHDHDHEHASTGWTVPAALALAALSGVAGWWIGRRGAAAAGFAVIAGGALSAPDGRAHGDDAHEAPAPTAPSARGAGVALPMESQFLLELRTGVVAREPFAEQVRAFGTAVSRPGGRVGVRAPVPGIVGFPRAWSPGDRVRRGDVIATITEALGGLERASYAELRGSASSALAEARRELALAERDADHADALAGNLSERDRLDRAHRLDVAREGLRQAEALAAQVAAGQPIMTLKAPFDAQISAIISHPGDAVAADAPILRLTGSAPLWVEVSVPEPWAGRLVVGGAATLSTDADHRVSASILDPGLEADPASGTLRVVLAVAEAAPWLVPGMSVTAAIDTGSAREAVVVPDSAIVDGTGETLVFVKTAPERFEVRPVRVGARSGDRREVIAGLDPGDRVVVQGTYALRSLAGR